MKPLTPASPHAIIMLGIPGSGKSTFAEHFAQTFQAPLVNANSLQKQYKLSDADTEKLRDGILDEFLKTKRTLLIEGGLERKSQRVELLRKLLKADYRPLVVWVQTDTSEALRRATKDYPAGSGLSRDAFEALVTQFQPPVAQEKAIVISGKHTYATQLKIVLKQIALGVDRSSDSATNPDTMAPPSDTTSGRGRGRSVVLR